LTGIINENGTQTALEPAPAEQNLKGFARDILETVGLAVVLFLVINLLSARVYVEGYSMRPTLDDGDYVLISRISYKLGDFQRGDIIVFRPPMYPNPPFWQRLFGLPTLRNDYQDYIKRIIGLPGETVRIANGSVYINDVPLQEPYIAAPANYSGEWTVPEGQLFVLGDNRNDSADSHSWGFLPQANVFGKGLLVYWPVKSFQVLPSHQAVLVTP
jgi:signal peptidase I